MKLLPIRLMLVLGILVVSARLSAAPVSSYSQAAQAAAEAGERPVEQVRISFPYGIGTLQDNAAEKNALKGIARNHKNDFVLVMAYASMEGNSAYNLVLSRKRAESVKDYLVEQGFPVEQVMIRMAGEDWDGLKSIIASKSFEGKAEVMNILNDDSISAERKKVAIKAVAGGKAWQWLSQNAMPELRSVMVSVFSKESLSKFLSGDWEKEVAVEKPAEPAKPKEEAKPVEQPKEEPKPAEQPKEEPKADDKPVTKGNVKVTGQLVDGTDGEPIIGAGIIPSTGGGTITDYDGRYEITVPFNASLTFSQLGYATVTEPVDGRSVINLSLYPDTQLLEEVVVLGFTSQKRAELTSAVVSVSGDKLTDVTTPDVGNMLQGKVAGVMVMNSSGQPGAGADIRIRGTGSITAGAGPLYVVDGVAGGSFNPNDIETLTVLKDASATALYGAAASGGVIVITTKNAKDEKVLVNFKASAGIKRALTGHFKAMDAYEMFDFCKQLYTTKTQLRSNAPTTTDENGNLVLDPKYNFDWMNHTFKTGVVQNYYASVTGKAGRVNYYVSLDHYNEQGSLINSGYKRTGARLNLSAPITDRINIAARVNYSKSHTNSERWRTRESSYTMMPFDIPYVIDQDGNITDEPINITSGRRPDNGKTWYSKNTYNVYFFEKYNYSKSHAEELTGDLQLTWNITDWLTFTSTNRYDSSNSYSEEYVDPRTTEVADAKGSLSNSDGEWNGFGTTNLLKFHKVFGDAHDVNAIIGGEYGVGYSRSMAATVDQFPAGMRSLSTGIMNDIEGNDYRSRTWALLGQAQYSYLGKYILTASIRYDQSYKFGPLNRGGFFPGVSGAWVASNEKFLSGNKNLTFLKVRAGFGKTGNDNIAPFKYQDTFSLTAQYNNVVSAFLERQANYRLGWEEAYMTSLGVDATIRNNWNFTLDLYHTINSSLLLDRPTPPSTGFFAITDNVGKVRNMGIELAADGAIIQKRDFRWDFGINVGVNQNRVLELPGHQDLPLSAGDVTQKVQEGRQIYSWYMPKWMGVDYETGKPLWEHLEYDEQGNITERTLTSSYSEATSQFCGDASPWLTGGLNTSISWKGITLSASGSFIVGNKIYNRTRWGIMDTDGAQQQFNQQSLNNGLGWVRWIEGDPYGTNSIATHPQAIKGGNNGAHNYSSRYLEDGSFFRLRNVTLSYDFPKNLISKIKMTGARIYVSADNLWTLTRFSGMDPEVNLEMSTWSLPGTYSDNYPIPMSVVMGIDIKF